MKNSFLSTKILMVLFFVGITLSSFCSSILIPMDKTQTNHLKAYGIAFYSLEKNISIKWLLNYRGGSFLIPYNTAIQNECLMRDIKYELIADVQVSNILNEIAKQDVNMDALQLDKAPKIAVYSPKGKQPWDDAVTLVLTYAEIPYDIVYDTEICEGKLKKYDWLHLHHEDFTGQYGKFYASYKHMKWYVDQQKANEAVAQKFGFKKVSKLKLHVAKTIKDFVSNGGFLFAMCSATDSFDIALAAHKTDICEHMYDGDSSEKDYQAKLDFANTFAFKNFTIESNPLEYEYSNIDATKSRKLNKSNDYFTLFEFSAKWDPVPTILCQNHTRLIPGFMGQTTSYNKEYIKPDVLIMGENKKAGEARYIHGKFNKGTWTFYGGHDPEDYKHFVGDKHTNLELHKNSPGYRLILNNILFPAAKKKKLKT